MKMIRSRLLATTLMVGAATVSSPALALQAGPPSATVDQETASEDGEAIVVTGSRIARPDLESSSPVTVVSAQEFQLQAGSANVENVLNDLPQVTPTTSGTSNNPGGGVATVNLRNLGSARTLVLVDGRRYMSFDVSQVVDLNTIPAALLDRVDVVTGGQSAVYGSDAIAGVVNFILKRDFSGIDLRSSYDITERGDGAIMDVSGTFGANLDDGRGNVTLFAQYTKRDPIFAGERDFARNALSDLQDGSPPFAAGGSPSVPQGRLNIPGLGTATGLGCNIQDFNPDGSNRCYVSANGYNFSPINYLQVPQERFLVSGMAEYEISEGFTPYLEAQFVNNRVPNQLAATPISNGTPFGDGTVGSLTLQVNSPFFTPAFRTALATLDTDGDGYVAAPGFNYRTTQIGPRFNQDERNAFRVVAGVKGDIGGGFGYDAYYLYARTKNSQRQSGNIAIDRFLAATTTAFLNPVTGAVSATPIPGLAGGGTLVCRDPAARAAGCAPANIFGIDNLSQEAIDYLSIGATNLEEYSTQVASAVITNSSLFDLGAGGIGIAIGAEYRKESGSVTPDQYLSSGNVAGFNPGLPTGGGYDVREGFAEIRIPLISESFIHRLELNGAARISDYSNAVGSTFTWAAGGEFAPVRDLTIRAQYQRAIRGPSVNELFLGSSVSFNGNADFCGTAAATTPGQLRDICVAQFTASGADLALIGNPSIQDPNNVNPLTFTGGNVNLTEEKATTYTIGAVFQPSFIPRFSATVDYYNIDLEDAIGVVPTDTIGRFCFVQFRQEYCDAIVRNSVGQIDSFTSLNANTGGIRTSGIDFSAAYAVPLGAVVGGDEVQLTFSYAGTRLLDFEVQPVSGDSFTFQCTGRFGNQCGVPTPKYRHTFRAGVNLGDTTISGQWRYIGKVSDDDDDVEYGSEEFDAQNYFDLSARFRATDNFEFGLGVSNLFDKQPPLGASGQNGGNVEQSNTLPTLYDVLGRSYFVNARARF